MPSPGSHTPPTRSSVRMIGQRAPASAAVISSASTSNARASDAVRRTCVMRASVRATVMLPQRFQPVAWPVSFSSDA